jgi:hypothetical protein
MITKKYYNYLVSSNKQILNPIKKESRAIPVTSRGGIKGCETSKTPNFLDNRLTDSGEVVNLMLRPRFTPQENYW